MHFADLDQIVAITRPDVGLDVRIFRNRTIFDLLPLIERGIRARHNAFVEAERDARDEQAGQQQRGEHLMCRHAAALHRDDLAVLVERRQRHDRPEQDRERQEAGDDLRQAQAEIAQDIILSVPRDAEDLARFAEQVERLEDEHEQHQHGEGTGEEHSPDIERKRPRREEMELFQSHTGCSPRLILSSLRSHAPALAKTRSSAPIG